MADPQDDLQDAARELAAEQHANDVTRTGEIGCPDY